MQWLVLLLKASSARILTGLSNKLMSFEFDDPGIPTIIDFIHHWLFTRIDRLKVGLVTVCIFNSSLPSLPMLEIDPLSI